MSLWLLVAMVLLSSSLVAILLFLLWRILAPRHSPRIRDGMFRPVKDSLSELLRLELGGINQWLLIRGWRPDAPVLLFLHGGPGMAHIGFFRHYQKVLERHFVVVQWDQRGAGLSGAGSVDDRTLNCAQLLQDALELSDWLRKRFQVSRIYLVGHSWGSGLGYLLAHRYPERFYAFAGIGQMSRNGERLAYEATLARAREQAHLQAIEELTLLGPPPYSRIPIVKGLLHEIEPGRESFAGMLVRYKWSDRLGGDAHGFSMVPVVAWDLLLRSREYTLADALAWLKRKGHCVNVMYDEFIQLDLFAEGTNFCIPVYFLTGTHDLLTVPSGAESLMNAIIAPAKELVVVDAGHEIMWERTEEYQHALIRLFLGKEVNNDD